MKNILTLILLTVFFTNSFSQKKPNPIPRIAGTSDLSKSDKWRENFIIKKEKFNVYLGYQSLNSNLRQIKGDTLAVYKIAFDKRKSSIMEITKYATRNGKIVAEGSYEIKKDTLITIANSYDYIGAFKIITKYSTDKYGFFEEINQKMLGIDTEKLSDKYLKPAEMKVPPPAKN